MVTFSDILLASKPTLMGVANITPDSFSDGGDLQSSFDIERHITQMISQNARIIDIGAESTKPNAAAIDADTEIARLKNIGLPLKKRPNIYYSIDSYKAKTVRFALENGFDIVNDIQGLSQNKDLAKIAADYQACYIIMYNHRLNHAPSISIIDDVISFFQSAIETALSSGIKQDQICLDIGIGFGLLPAENIMLIQEISRLKNLGFPIMVGASRKSFIHHYLNIENPKDRDGATLGIHKKCVENGADILRVHDVKLHDDFFKIYEHL